MIWNLSGRTDYDVVLGSGPDDLDSSEDRLSTLNRTPVRVTSPPGPDPPLSGGCQLYSFVVYTVVIGLLCVLGIVGNTLTFLVFLKDKLKTSASFLFQGISAIDSALLVTVFPIYCIPPFIDYTNWYPQYYDFGYAIALVYIFPLALMAQTATVWATVLVAVNRYVAVCRPYQAARLCTVGQAKIQLSAVLVFSVMYNVPKFAESRLEVRTGDDNATVVLRPQYTALQDKWWYLIIYGNIFYLLVMLILPLVTLTVLNIRLVRALKALRRKRAEMQQSARQQQDNSVTLVLIVVILVFTFCQTPALATQILWNILADEARQCGGFQFYFSRVSNLLVVANSSVNFLVYYSFNGRFRQVLGQTLSCCVGEGGEAEAGGGETGGAGGGRGTADYQAVRSGIVDADRQTVVVTTATVVISGGGHCTVTNESRRAVLGDGQATEF